MMPAAMISACVAGARYVVECGQYDLRALGLWQQLDGDFGDDAEHGFGAGAQARSTSRCDWGTKVDAVILRQSGSKINCFARARNDVGGLIARTRT